MEEHLLSVSSLTPSGSHCAGLFSTSVLGGSSSAPNLQDYARSHRKKLTSSGCIDGMCAHARTGSHLLPRMRSRVVFLKSKPKATDCCGATSFSPANACQCVLGSTSGPASVRQEQLNREYMYSKWFVQKENLKLFQLKENLDAEE